MAVRFVALLIPLAITVPQLQTSRPSAPEPQPPAALTQPANETEPAREARHFTETASTRVASAPSLHEAARVPDSESVDTPAVAAAAAAPELRSVPHKRAAPKLARTASPVKLVAANAAPGQMTARAATRKMKPLLAANDGCLPSVHCAPVVVAKVTPVVRRPL